MSAAIGTVFGLVIMGVVGFMLYKQYKAGVFGALGGGGSAGMQQAQEEADAAMTRLGYEYTARGVTSAAEQSAMLKSGQPIVTDANRQVGQYRLRYYSSYSMNSAGTMTYTASWQVPTAHQQRVALHIVDKSIASKVKNAALAMANVDTNWKPAYAQEVSAQDPELSGRFRFFAADPRQAEAIINDPALKAYLMPLFHVDIVVAPDQTYLSDPLNASLTKAAGGAMKMAAMVTRPGGGYAKLLEDTHGNISNALVYLADRTAI